MPVFLVIVLPDIEIPINMSIFCFKKSKVHNMKEKSVK